ncbi:MAG: hypothetical protein GWO20_14620 [Candidatus Korarchaeota archaeon]|nr:hypothetical protein [Candidatus Korarchaeota archaeon]
MNEVFLTYKSFLENFTGANQEDVVLTAFKRVIAQYKVPNFGLSEPKKKDRPGEDGIEELSSGESLREPDQEEQETREFLAIDQATLVEQDELNEFTITPNMQFSQPPKCNVFFPASFTGYGMHRNAFQEPTRLYGRVNLTPSSRDSNGTAIEFYIAPHWQAFHHLNEDHLSRFTPAYRQMIQNLPNQAQEGIDGG